MSWKDARRILCVRLDSMGDLLMTGPAIRAIRETLEGSSITLLTSKAGAKIASLMPEVDDIVVYEAPWMKPPLLRRGPGPDLLTIAELAERAMDAAAIFTVFTQSALPAALHCYLAGIPLRLAHSRENPYHLLTDWVKESEPEAGIRHEVRRQLDLVGKIGMNVSDPRLKIAVPESARTSVRSKLEEWGLAGCSYAVVHPGASAASRMYPAEQYRAAVRGIGEASSLAVIVTGSWAERELARSVALGAGRCVVAAGELDLAELAALLESAAVAVTNNTGPAHLAAAVGAPVVDLYALTNPQHTPWGVESRVLFSDVPCKACMKSACPLQHHRCLREVSPRAVTNAALELAALPRTGAFVEAKPLF